MPTLQATRKSDRTGPRAFVALIHWCALLLLVACSSSDFGGAREPMARTAAAAGSYDIVITNGRVIDGTGNAWFAADVGIRGDRIARIAPAGMLAAAPAATRIDAGGKVVSPGFIDIQGQSVIGFTVGDGRDAGKV